MKQTVLLLLSLFAVAKSENAVISVVPSKQQLDAANAFSASAGVGCFEQQFDGTCKDGNGAAVTCDCPAGTQCIGADADVGRPVSVCQALATVVHQGGVEYDYEAPNIIKAPTQVPWLTPVFTTGTAVAGIYPQVAADTTGDAAGTADTTYNQAATKNVYPRYKVTLSGVDPLKYTKDCTVTIGTAGMGSKATLSITEGEDVSGPSGFTAVTASGNIPGQVECTFRVKNAGYLGLATVSVKFTKDPLQLVPGEKAFKQVETHIRFVPGPSDDDWHNPQKWGSQASLLQGELFPDHDSAAAAGSRHGSADDYADDQTGAAVAGKGSVFKFQYDATSTTFFSEVVADGYGADKGTVKLPISGTFLDGRYLIFDQSGVASLQDTIADGAMRKEGMDIHYDFKDFYVAEYNSFDNGGIKMTPRALFSDYAANKNDAAAHADYAQMEMKHTYSFTYGGADRFGKEMPHFKPEYLSCPLCDAQIVFKAFQSTHAYDPLGTQEAGYLLNYHAPLDVSKLPSSSNTIDLDDVDVQVVANVDGNTNYGEDGSGGNIALRLILTDDPQNPDGHKLSEFFKVVLRIDGSNQAVQKSYASLIAPYNILGARFTTKDNAGAEVAISTCDAEGVGKGKLYMLGSDIVAKAQGVFESGCRVELTGSFGDTRKLYYDPTRSDPLVAWNFNGADVKESIILITDTRTILAGSTELSILRRKVDTEASNSADKVTFGVSQRGVAAGLDFKILGSNTMLGYGDNGVACAAADVTNSLRECKGVLKLEDTCTHATTDTSAFAAVLDKTASAAACTAIDAAATWTAVRENEFKVSGVDDVQKLVTIRSSSDCFLYMDIELEDVNAPFAKYGLRLPCVRTTDSLDDELHLEYAFKTEYKLSDDSVSAEIDYKLNTGDMTLTVDDKGFGTCGADSNGLPAIAPPTGCAVAIPNTDWTDDGTSKLTLNAGKKIADLQSCATTSTVDSTNDEYYTLEHYLALVYARDLGAAGRTGDSQKYCADQKFITTINRDATASVTVATLVSPVLERNVIITDMQWAKCASTADGCKGSDSCYQYIISADAKKREKTSGAANAWSDAVLNAIMHPATDTSDDIMTIVDGTTGDNAWSLTGACAPITACDATDAHYNDVADGTKQEIILQGSFDGSQVQSIATLETKYIQCPLKKATVDLGGELLLGLKLGCELGGNDAARSTSDANQAVGAAVPATDKCNGPAACLVGPPADLTACNAVDPACFWGTATQNCASALSTALIKVDADIFMDRRDAVGLLEATTTQGWSMKSAKYYINRYERDVLGNIDRSKQLSSDFMMEYEWTSGVAFTCTKKQGGLTGLPQQFDAAELVCETAPTNANAMDFKFDLAPMQFATMDVFEVEIVGILRNNAMETRHLRHSLVLGASDPIDESSTGFQVIELGKEDAEKFVDNHADDTVAEKTAKGQYNATLVIVILVAVITAIASLAAWAAGACNMCCSKEGQGRGIAVAQVPPAGSGQYAPVGRSERFSNLRY